MTLSSTAATNDRRSLYLVLSNRAVLIFVSALIFLPSALFATALRPTPAMLVLAGCTGGLALIAQRPRAMDWGFLDAPIDMRCFVLCIALACVILMVGGELHLFYATQDWRIRDAVLADLTQGAFPIIYKVAGTDYILRAPLGMYMIPATIGHAFGLLGAHAALLTQNTLVLGSIFYLLVSLGCGWPHLAILIFFGGLSLIGAYFAYLIANAYGLDRWVKFGDAWNRYFQYSCSMVQFFWVPNHALPGWWLATLLLLQTRSEVDSATVGVSLAGAMFWSPLVVIPVALWLTYLAATNSRRHLLAWRTWLGVLAGVCFLPVAFYMVIGSSEIAHGYSANKPAFTPLYILFIAIQMPSALFAFLNRRLIPISMLSLFYINVVILLILPFFVFGNGNDMVMRGSISSLVIVSFVFGGIICDPAISRMTKFLGYALIILSSPSTLLEVSRNIIFARYNFSDCSLIEANYAWSGDKRVPTNYGVESAQVPSWLMGAEATSPLSARPRRCWTDIDNRRE